MNEFLQDSSADKKPFHVTLKVLYRLYCNRLEGIAKEVDLTIGQPHILLFLKQKAGCSQKDICDFFHFKAATVTVLLQRMEKQGLIVRIPDSHDQRVIRLNLTEKGKEKTKHFQDLENRLETECLAGFTERERTVLLHFMNRIHDNLKCLEEGR